ncbi:hypothetical protein B9Z55_007518 [Caenorhabditis nigoni]|uniref:Uncharacterized protein n=1 Tax=Caenorhabditis nigoni TaxID=1611254 RepID=A0A2G5VA03_9PELO|nr:hypothetical protein B9Z55_007518 [Caenorhabditis nigoni]
MSQTDSHFGWPNFFLLGKRMQHCFFRVLKTKTICADFGTSTTNKKLLNVALESCTIAEKRIDDKGLNKRKKRPEIG